MAFLLRSVFFIGVIFTLSPVHEGRQGPSVLKQADRLVTLAEAVRRDPDGARKTAQFALQGLRAGFPDEDGRAHLRALIEQVVATAGGSSGTAAEIIRGDKRAQALRR